MGASKTVKRLIFAVKLFVVFACAFLFGYFLWKFGYFSQFSAIDNVLALLPFALSLCACGLLSAALFLQHTRRFALLCALFALFSALCFGLFPVSLYQAWWAPRMTTEIGGDPSLDPWKPFSGDKVATLPSPASLNLKEDLPILDGALALYPVYAAMAQAVYDQTAYEGSESVQFTDTVRAFSLLVAGERDLVLMAGPSEKQLAEARAAGVELTLTPIGQEAFVFLVGETNPTESITLQQIRNIYSGKTKDWRTLGWAEGGRILAYRRPEGSGSESALQRLMKGLPLIAPQPLFDSSLLGSNSLMQQVSVEYRGVQPALGYSYRFFATVMNPNPAAKMLAIGGAAPDEETISRGAYPLTAKFYAVTRADASENTKKLVAWLTGEEGSSLISAVGYFPL